MTETSETGGCRQSPAPPALYGCRLRFSKDGMARFLSHHDLLRTFERCLRRTGLDISFTCGMNPHPRMSVRPAMALGARALAASFDFFLAVETEPLLIADAVGATTPAGIVVVAASAFPGVRPAPMSEVRWVFDLPVPGEEDVAAFSARYPGATARYDGGKVRVAMQSARGQEPSGPRAMAELLWPSSGVDPVMSATLESVSFEDGV